MRDNCPWAVEMHIQLPDKSQWIFRFFNCKIHYSKYLGDGDTASFTKLVESQPYEDELKPVKLECVWHYQKRKANCLQQKRKNFKGGRLPDEKGISGRGILTDKVINTLQNYVGMVIRKNSNDIKKMRNSIIATLYHCTWESHCTEESCHLFCSKGKNSWCKWQSEIATGKQTYKKKLNLPVAIMNEIKPVFQELLNVKMLEKCLHGMTQN